MKTEPTIVILARDGDSTRILYHAVAARYPVQKVILEAPVSRWQFMKNRAKKMGWFTVGSQALFQAVVARWLTATSGQRRAEIYQTFGLNNAPVPENIVLRVPSANSPEAIAALQGLQPHLVLINGTRILSKKLLSCVEAPFVNTHAGITPLYRGVHGGYWALAQNDAEHCGVTVHLVDPGVDTGQILAQAAIQPTAQDNFTTYPVLQQAAGLPLLLNLIPKLLSGEAATQPPPAGKSALWSHPTLGQYLRNRLRGIK